MEDYPTPLADNVADNQVHELTATYLTLGEQNACAIFDNGKTATRIVHTKFFGVWCFPFSNSKTKSFFFFLLSSFLLGDVYSWGGRTWIEPQRMSVLSDKGVYQVACGKNFTAAVDDEGKLYTWTKSGVMGRSSALGHGDRSSKAQPTLVEELTKDSEKGARLTTIAAGSEHMLACKYYP